MEPFNVKEEGLSITTNVAFTVDKASITANHTNPGVETAFSLNIVPMHAIGPGGGLRITYPP